MPKYKTIIFVHGCFWHHHNKCIDGKIPQSAYWQNKIKGTIARDTRHQRELKRLGWQVITVWECEIENKKFDIKSLSSIIRKIKG